MILVAMLILVMMIVLTAGKIKTVRRSSAAGRKQWFYHLWCFLIFQVPFIDNGEGALQAKARQELIWYFKHNLLIDLHFGEFQQATSKRRICLYKIYFQLFYKMKSSWWNVFLIILQFAKSCKYLFIMMWLSLMCKQSLPTKNIIWHHNTI